MGYLLGKLTHNRSTGWSAKYVIPDVLLCTAFLDYTIEIELDPSWDVLPVKYVVFSAGDLQVRVKMDDNVVKVPNILFERPYCYLFVGAYATDIEYDEAEAERARAIKRQMDEKLEALSYMAIREEGYWDLMEEYNALKEELSNVNLPKVREQTGMYNLGFIQDGGKPYE